MLISDRFGMRPLYWAQVGEGLIFASEIKALLAVPGLSCAMSPEGIGQFFAFGQYLGERTSFEAISVLPAASVLQFDLATGRVQVESYGAVEPLADLPATREASLDAVTEALVASVERQTITLAGSGSRCPAGSMPAASSQSCPAHPANHGEPGHPGEHRPPRRRDAVGPFRSPSSPPNARWLVP